MNYKIRVTRMTVAPQDEPIFSERATHIEIEDEATGEYLKIRQINDNIERGEIAITPEEWPHIKDAVETLMKGIRP